MLNKAIQKYNRIDFQNSELPQCQCKAMKITQMYVMLALTTNREHTYNINKQSISLIKLAKFMITLSEQNRGQPFPPKAHGEG